MTNELFPVGTKIQDKQGNRGTVVAHYNHFGKHGYTVEWFSLRHGKKIGNIGPNAVKRMEW